MPQNRVRDYVEGWTAYHSGPEADVAALTEAVCDQLRHNPNRALTPYNRKELQQALGTKDAADARTLTNVVHAVLVDDLDAPCVFETARAVTETVLSVYETGWDLQPTTRLPRALIAAYRQLLHRDLTPDRARTLVDAHTSRSDTGLVEDA